MVKFHMRIYCPRCGWQPDRDSRWGCVCLHAWNTFETSGRCPNCDRQWKDTQCLSCHEWSPHEQWYHDKDTVPPGRERSQAPRETVPN